MKVAINILKGLAVTGAFVTIWAIGVYGGENCLGDNIILVDPKSAADLRKRAYEVMNNPHNSERIRRKARIVYDSLEDQIK